MDAPIVVKDGPLKQVVPDERSGLQVVNPDFPIAATEEKQVIDSYIPKEAAKPKRSRRRLWIGIAAAIAVIIIAIVVPVVVTQRHRGSSSSSSSETGKHSDPQNSTAPTSELVNIASTSALSATAWTVDQAYRIRLVYQTEDGYLQAATHDSATGKWTKTATNFTRAKAGSPLAITWFDRGRPTDLQLALFYVDGENYIRGWAWDSELSPQGRVGSISERNLTAHADSSLSAYWPFIVYTDADQKLHEVKFEDGEYRDNATNLTVANGGAISITPAAQQISSMNVFFQRDDEYVVQYNRDSKSDSYTRNSTLLGHQIPLDAPIASFALPNVQDPRRLDTYFLCQDRDTNINMRWLDDETGWKGVKIPDAFKGADKWTSLACITTHTSTDVLMKKGAEVPRCYFRAGGTIREVQLDNDSEDWKVIGNVTFG